MAQRRKSGSGGGVKTAIWWVVLAMVALAIWRGSDMSGGPQGIYNWFAGWVPGIEKTMTDIGDNVTETIEKADPNASKSPSPAAS